MRTKKDEPAMTIYTLPSFELYTPVRYIEQEISHSARITKRLCEVDQQQQWYYLLDYAYHRLYPEASLCKTTPPARERRRTSPIEVHSAPPYELESSVFKLLDPDGGLHTIVRRFYDPDSRYWYFVLETETETLYSESALGVGDYLQEFIEGIANATEADDIPFL